MPIEHPAYTASKNFRMVNIGGTKESGTARWVVGGPRDEILAAKETGLIAYNTGRFGARVGLVGAILRDGDSFYAECVDPTFPETASRGVKAIAELSDEDFEAEAARRRAAKSGGTQVTSAAKSNGARKANGASKRAAKPTDVVQDITPDAAAADALVEVDDDEIAVLTAS